MLDDPHPPQEKPNNRPRKGDENEPQSETHEAKAPRPSEDSADIASSQHSRTEQWRNPFEKWTLLEKVSVLLTLFLVILTGCLATATIKLAVDTHALVEGEHRNTVLSHRAWVAITPGIASDLVWTDDDVRIKIAVAMTNFSNFPATKVTIRPEMTLAKRGVKSTASDVSVVLKEKRNMPEAELSGTYIFPGKENVVTQLWDVSITNLEIEQWVQEQKRGKGGQFANQLPITISIYVTYKSIFGDEIYMSSISRSLLHKSVNGQEAPFTKKSGNVPMQDLELMSNEGHID